MVAFEAVGAGAVPLVSDRCGIELTHGQTGLVHRVADETALAEHLAVVLDPEKAQTMRHRILYERERWTWQSAARRLVEVYDQELERFGK